MIAFESQCIYIFEFLHHIIKAFNLDNHKVLYLILNLIRSKLKLNSLRLNLQIILCLYLLKWILIICFSIKKYESFIFYWLNNQWFQGIV
jgi:hypothetical protein